MRIASDITELVGHTPLVQINKLNSGAATIAVKAVWPVNSRASHTGIETVNAIMGSSHQANQRI